jgi:hypothetical protein
MLTAERVSEDLRVTRNADEEKGWQTEALPPEKELLWREYQLQVDLYKHYLELVIRVNVFYYAITGAILSFYFSRNDGGTLRWSLLLPVAMSVLFAMLFLWGAWLNRLTRDEIKGIGTQLGFGVWPEVSVLSALLVICASFFSLVAAALLYLFSHPHLLTAKEVAL